MKKFLYTVLVVVICVWMSRPGFAGPFIKIDNVDISSSYPLIKLYLSVRGNENTWIDGLNEENIYVYEDGYRVNYVQVAQQKHSDDILHIVFSIDSSKSISEAFLAQIKKAAKEIVTSTEKDERIALYRFNDKVLMLNNFSDNRLELIRKIDSIERHGTKTLLYSSVYDSIDLLSKVEGNRKAIIIFTDGKDEGSSLSSEDVISFAKEHAIPLYFMCLKNSQNIQKLERMSILTGGKLIYGDDVVYVTRMYRAIIQRIKSQYLVKYHSMIKRDGLPHMLEVRLKFDSLRDRDQRKISLPSRMGDLRLPSLSEIIMVILLFLLFLLLIIFLLIMFRKGRSNNSTRYQVVSSRTIEPDKHDFVSAYSQTTEAQKQHALPSEPDSYAYYRAWLVQKEGADKNNKFPIRFEEMTMGSGRENTLVIEDPTVSSTHAKIRQTQGGYYLFDMASDQGTFLNGKKLLRPKQLYDWDEIQLGNTMLIFRGSHIS